MSHGYLIGGWKDKYRIETTSGKPVDPDAKYFVLRWDKDPHARQAMLAYAKSVAQENPRFACDIVLQLAPYARESEWVDTVLYLLTYILKPNNNLASIELHRLIDELPEVR